MPDTLVFTNNAVAIVNTDLAAGDTVLTLAPGDGDKFPPTLGAFFSLTLEDRRVQPVQREIATCTQRLGDVLTLRRAQEGTLAGKFNAGFTVSNRLTAQPLNVIMSSAVALNSLWLGVHPIPPTTGTAGEPIPLGAMYFNSVTGLMYTWDGTQWRSLFVPQQALTIRLFYVATAGQTDFGNDADLRGFTLQLNAVDQAPVMVYRNGELQWLTGGTGARGDYTVDYANNKIVLVAPAVAGDEYEIDQLVPISRLPPAATDTRPLRDINLDPATGTPGYINGERVLFPLAEPDGDAITVDNAHQLGIMLDGVQQRPGVDYTATGTSLSFAFAPPAGTSFWGYYYGVRGGTLLSVPAPTIVGQILIADADLEPVWSTVLDEGTY